MRRAGPPQPQDTPAPVQPRGRAWDGGARARGCRCPPSLAPRGASGTRGEQPPANFPRALEFRRPAATAALPACDTVPRRSRRIKCANFSPGASLPTPPPPGARCPARRSPGMVGTSHCLLQERGTGGISVPSLLAGFCRDGGGTPGRVTLPTAECHQPGAVAGRETFRASCEGSRSPRSLPCRCEETRWDQASWGPKDTAGVCTGADASVLGCTGALHGAQLRGLLLLQARCCRWP